MKASERQVGGSHYSKLAIQPATYSELNKLSFLQGNAIKYITRFRDKDGIKDLNKAIHCIELLIEQETNKPSKPKKGKSLWSRLTRRKS